MATYKFECVLNEYKILTMILQMSFLQTWLNRQFCIHGGGACGYHIWSFNKSTSSLVEIHKSEWFLMTYFDVGEADDATGIPLKASAFFIITGRFCTSFSVKNCHQDGLKNGWGYRYAEL